jgi:hypothetical protein
MRYQKRRPTPRRSSSLVSTDTLYQRLPHWFRAFHRLTFAAAMARRSQRRLRTRRDRRAIS